MRLRSAHVYLCDGALSGMNFLKKWRWLSISAHAGIVGFIAGAICAGFVVYLFDRHESDQNLRAVRQSDIASSSAYEFTDPLISVSLGGVNPAPEYTQLYKQVSSYIAGQQNVGLAAASVSFRDINNSDGFNVNPSTLYDPASLTKIPLAMAYYSLAEQQPSVLSQSVNYSGTPDLDANEQVESPVQLVPGNYTVEQLIEHLIRYSDNNAEQLLADQLAAIGQLPVLSTLFADLGVKSSPDNPDYATAQSYSLFLRVLYNATYLDRDYSEKLLQLLSQSDFSKGIEAGVPNGILIAQKFGDARIPNAQGQQVGAELQDCGIIYYPDHPYVLCVMTKGANISVLESTISNISQIVYQDIEQRYPQ